MTREEFNKQANEAYQKGVAEFAAAHANEPEDRKLRDARHSAGCKAENVWKMSLAVYESIFQEMRDDRTEIRDEIFGGTITVYRPHREYYCRDEKPIIRSGYINASSWEAGNSRTEDPNHARQEMMHRMRMMEIALELINRYNEVLPDWQMVEDPFQNARHLEEEVVRYRAIERQRFAEDKAKKDARDAKKVARA